MSRTPDPKPPTFKCGHVATPENTQRAGRVYPYGRCRYCRMVYHREQRQIKTPRAVLIEPPRLLHLVAPVVAEEAPADPAIIAYRTEKARRQERDSRWSQQLAEARAEVARVDALRKEQQKGGRPKGRRTDQPQVFTPGKPKLNAVKIPAEDVLLYAVEEFRGLSR